MAERASNPFRPRLGETFTKGEIDRAGRSLVVLRNALVKSDQSILSQMDPEEIASWFRALGWWRMLHARPLLRVANGLRHHVASEAALVNDKVDVTQRLKREPTIVDKLDRHPAMKLSRMADIGGVRARVPDLESLNRVSKRLLRTWRTIERPHRDYVENPQGSGYRGIHLYVKKDGVRIEVQIRTANQDLWANMVERVSRETGIDYKSGKGDIETLELFRLAAEGYAHLDRGERVPASLVAQIEQARDNALTQDDR